MAKKHETDKGKDSAEAAEADGSQDTAQPVNKNKRYRRDKPWDTDDIDQLKAAVAPEAGKEQPLLAESSFAVLFPKYRESYLRQTWGNVVSSLSPYGITAVLDLVEGSMTVKTTRKTYDPYIIIKARDFIKLLARSVPFPQAVKVLEDGMSCEVVKISGIVRNKERFVKRRQRLVGPDGQTLKAIELLTQCYILVQGNTVSVLGSHKGIKQARKVILDCMDNIHPIYHIKEMMVRRQLAQDPKMAEQDWSRFLPKFEKRRQKKRKDKEPINNTAVGGNYGTNASTQESSSNKAEKKREKKTYTPFPPPRQPSKRDMELATGDFFKKEKERKQKFKEEMETKKVDKAEEKKRNREKAFIPVEEKPHSSKSAEDGSPEKNKKRKKKEAKEGDDEEVESKRERKRRKESKKSRQEEED